MKKIALTQKPLTIKELSLFSMILFYFRLGHHDNNENLINLFLMPHSKCLPLKFQNISCTNNEDSTCYHLLYLGKCMDCIINSIVLLLLC